MTDNNTLTSPLKDKEEISLIEVLDETNPIEVSENTPVEVVDETNLGQTEEQPDLELKGLEEEYIPEEQPDYSKAENSVVAQGKELTPGRKYASHMLPSNWREMFLEHYRRSGNKTFAARMAGVKSVKTVYNEIDRNPDFAFEVEQARMLAVEALHNEAIRRAMGEPLRNEDGEIIARQQPSDKLLIFMLSSMSPEDYGHGAIQAEARRQNMRDDEDTKVRISLPENFRGKITIGREDHFPDADILDAKFADLGKPKPEHEESDTGLREISASDSEVRD